MTALEEIKKPLEGRDVATLTNVELVTEISRLLSTLESLQAKNEGLLKRAATAEKRLRGANAAFERERKLHLKNQGLNRKLETRAEAAEAEVKRLRDLLRFSHDTLWEINPSNYDHDDVCKLNDASVEVILAIAPELGESALASTGGEHNAE
jgi:predicted RNase H-like nuclease (RuvC/YqgF family)